MSDLKARMAKQLAARTEPDSPPETPTAPAPLPKPQTFDHRISLDLGDEDYRALKLGAVDEATTVAKILRSLVDLWRTDNHTRQQVTERLTKSNR